MHGCAYLLPVLGFSSCPAEPQTKSRPAYATGSDDVFARYGFDLPDNATAVLETLQAKVEVVAGRKNKMLFADPVLEQALVWAREAMKLKEEKLSETFGEHLLLPLNRTLRTFSGSLMCTQRFEQFFLNARSVGCAQRCSTRTATGC